MDIEERKRSEIKKAEKNFLRSIHSEAKACRMTSDFELFLENNRMREIFGEDINIRDKALSEFRKIGYIRYMREDKNKGGYVFHISLKAVKESAEYNRFEID